MHLECAQCKELKVQRSATDQGPLPAATARLSLISRTVNLHICSLTDG